jgi:hypothetical protein
MTNRKQPKPLPVEKPVDTGWENATLAVEPKRWSEVSDG